MVIKKNQTLYDTWSTSCGIRDQTEDHFHQYQAGQPKYANIFPWCEQGHYWPPAGGLCACEGKFCWVECGLVSGRWQENALTDSTSWEGLAPPPSHLSEASQIPCTLHISLAHLTIISHTLYFAFALFWVSPSHTKASRELSGTPFAFVWLWFGWFGFSFLLAIASHHRVPVSI